VAWHDVQAVRRTVHTHRASRWPGSRFWSMHHGARLTPTRPSCCAATRPAPTAYSTGATCPPADAVVGRYQGRRGAVRDATRADYRRCIEAYWNPLLGPKRLATITAPDFARALAELAARDGNAYIADATLRRIYAPLSSLMAVATEEGVIRHNVCRDVSVPSGRDRLQFDDTDDHEADREVKAYTREQVTQLLGIVPDPHRLLLLLLASTGLRVSAAVGLRWKDLHLDGSDPHVRVRRAIVKGVVGPPKSRHGQRNVPVPREVVIELRRLHKQTEWPERDDLVFASSAGTPWRPENVRQSLVPFVQEAGLDWIGFHGLRHFYASALTRPGGRFVQVSRAVGHHSPAFPLSVYGHMLDDGIGGPIDLAGVLRPRRALDDAVAA
jgi:integrase